MLDTEGTNRADGGLVIDIAVSALRAVITLANNTPPRQELDHLKGDELACLLKLISDEIEQGRAQQGT